VRGDSSTGERVAEQGSRHTLLAALRFPCILVLALLAASCSKQTTPDRANTNDGLEVVTDRDVIVVRLRTDRKSLTIADRLQLWLEVDAPEDFQVELPPVGDKLQQFGIVDVGTAPPVLVGDGKVRRVRHYVLEPFLSGEYRIAPMVVKYQAKGKTGDMATIETKELTVQVKSELPEDQKDRDIHDIEHSLLPPPPSHMVLWLSVGGGGVALVVVVALLVWWRRRHRSEAPELRIPAHELAYAELRELVAANLVEQGLVKEFYQGVSNILRRYLERRFGLHAPERTTEEFLAELAADDTLSSEHKAVLGTFLQHCDLVKFAKLEPSEEEIQQTFDACKNVIEQTKEVVA
jgi:hypothetical protein